jgi:hypothetical protein
VAVSQLIGFIPAHAQGDSVDDKAKNGDTGNYLAKFPVSEEQVGEIRYHADEIGKRNNA